MPNRAEGGGFVPDDEKGKIKDPRIKVIKKLNIKYEDVETVLPEPIVAEVEPEETLDDLVKKKISQNSAEGIARAKAEAVDFWKKKF